MSDEIKECFVVGNYKIQNECEPSACDQESGVDTYINSGGNGSVSVSVSGMCFPIQTLSARHQYIFKIHPFAFESRSSLTAVGFSYPASHTHNIQT